MKKRLKIQDQHWAQLKLAYDIQDGERALGSMRREEKTHQESALKVIRQQVKPDSVATQRWYANSEVVRDVLQTWLRHRELHSLFALSTGAVQGRALSDQPHSVLTSQLRDMAEDKSDEEQHDGSERDAAPSQGVTAPAVTDVLEEPCTEGSFPEASLLVDTDCAGVATMPDLPGERVPSTECLVGAESRAGQSRIRDGRRRVEWPQSRLSTGQGQL